MQSHTSNIRSLTFQYRNQFCHFILFYIILHKCKIYMRKLFSASYFSPSNPKQHARWISQRVYNSSLIFPFLTHILILFVAFNLPKLTSHHLISDIFFFCSSIGIRKNNFCVDLWKILRDMRRQASVHLNSDQPQEKQNWKELALKELQLPKWVHEFYLIWPI